jgi:hypothetical protein
MKKDFHVSKTFAIKKKNNNKKNPQENLLLFKILLIWKYEWIRPFGS